VITVPVPLNWTTVVAPLEELLLIVNCPVVCPAAVGSNSTFKVTDWFGFSVTGRVAPESLKLAPLKVAVLIVRGAVPDEVKVNGSVAVEFTATLPNESELALTVSCGEVTTVPVPLSWTTAVEPLEELLVIVSCPVVCPAAPGLNRTFSVTDWFGFSVTGRVAPESLKSVPLSVAALIVSGAVPDEVKVNGSVALLFTDTLPKDSEFALTVNCGVVTTVPLPLSWTTVVAPLEELLPIVN
jgi:hypothetical protein